jgi:hypothetical protein
MGAFPGSALRTALYLATGLVALAGSVAWAQSQVGPPIRLGPPPDPSATAPQDADKRPHAPHGIAADTLPPPSPDAAGVLGAHDRPLPGNLWQGMTGSTALALLPRIGSTNSPALQDLAYRLLASPAAPPEGDQPAGALLALRAERLTNALGRTDAALALLQGAPAAEQSEAMGQITVDLAFLSGDSKAACALVHNRDKSWQETYWDQGSVTCEAVAGNEGAARLGLDMLREAKFKDDGFATLVEATLAGAKPPDTLPTPQPMSLALLGKDGAGLPKRALDGANLAILRAVAIGTGFPADQKLVATERAAEFGALPAGKLADAYLALPLDQGEKDSPLTQADKAPPYRGRAILFAAAHNATIPTARANFLSVLLGHAPKNDLYFVLVRAAEPLLLQIPPTQDLSTAAAEFARAFYALDRPKDAAAWLAVAPPDQAAALLPLAHIANDSAAPGWGRAGLTELLGGVTRDSGLVQKRAVLAAQLLAADGTPPPAALLLPLLEAKVGVPPNVVPGVVIESEAAAHHIGGTILTVLTGLDDQGAFASGALMAQAIAGLRAVGLQDEARHLAIDAAIAGGL